MSVTIKALPAIQIAELTATAASYSPQDISPVIQPLYPELLARLAAAGVPPAGSELAWHEPVPGRSGAVRVHAAVPVAARPGPAPGLRGPRPAAYRLCGDDPASRLDG